MLVTDKPEDLPTGNDLDNVEDPDELDEYGLTIDRYVGFGTTPKAIPNPPKVDEIVEYRVKVVGRGDSRKRRTDGEMRYRSEVEILSVARAGDELPPDYEPPATAAQLAKAKREEERLAAEAAAAVARAEVEENQPPMFTEDGDPLPADPDAEHGDTFGAEPVVDKPAFSDAGVH